MVLGFNHYKSDSTYVIIYGAMYPEMDMSYIGTSHVDDHHWDVYLKIRSSEIGENEAKLLTMIKEGSK